MTQASIPLKTELVSYRYDRGCMCGPEGRMRPTGLTLLTDPPRYPHKCTACGREETFLVSYPYLGHEPA
jgi:hypothetical protein